MKNVREGSIENLNELDLFGNISNFGFAENQVIVERAQ